MTMTEWNGIKVGFIYKMTGRGRGRRAPLMMVTALTGHGCIDRGVPMKCNATVINDETGVETIELAFDGYEHECVQVVETRSPGMGSRSRDISEYEVYKPWPYKEITGPKPE